MRTLFLYLLLFLSACTLPQPNHLRKAIPSKVDGISEDSPSTLKIFIPYVGQGDATLIQTPSGRSILIDTGPPSAGRIHLYPLFQKLGIRKLDGLIISHYDLDHMGGFVDLIQGPDREIGTADDLPVAVVYDRGGTPWDSSPGYDDYLDLLEKKNTKHQTLEPGESIDLDPEVEIRCLAANGKVWFKNGPAQEVDLSPETYAGRENASSISLLIEYKAFRYLTSGDLTGGGSLDGFLTPDIETLLGESAGPIDALHANHHGSLNSSNGNFVSATSPETVFIQAGVENTYHHPHDEVVRRWKESGARVFTTENGKGFVLTSDGKGHEIWLFNQPGDTTTKTDM